MRATNTEKLRREDDDTVIFFLDGAVPTYITNPITGLTTDFLPLFYPHNVHLYHSKKQQSKRFDCFFHLFAKFGLD